MATLLGRIGARLTILLLVVVLVGGCTGSSPLPAGLFSEPGWVSIRFDGERVGDGGADAYPRTACGYRDTAEPPVFITREDRWCCGSDVHGDWLVDESDGVPADLRLDLAPGDDRPASAELTLGNALFAPDHLTIVTATEPRLSTRDDDVLIWAGRVTLEDVPLVSGDPWDGASSLARLTITWECEAG